MHTSHANKKARQCDSNWISPRKPDLTTSWNKAARYRDVYLTIIVASFSTEVDKIGDLEDGSDFLRKLQNRDPGASLLVCKKIKENTSPHMHFISSIQQIAAKQPLPL